MIRGIFLLLGVILVLQLNGAYANASVPPKMKREAARILKEGDRIKRQAHLMRSESARLKKQAEELRAKASRLDVLWESARRLNPDNIRESEGRDRSQRRMRLDADREERDSEYLVREG